MKKIGVVLSGCGVMDGSEIHESVLTLLALDQAGVEVVCMAPNQDLSEVNHLTNEVTGKQRNVLLESARIARGEIVDLAQVKSTDLDALVFPGGFGAAKNLCDFAMKGADAVAHPDVSQLILEMHSANKVIGAMCIAPALLAIVLGEKAQPILTIGNDAGTAQAIESFGARHQNAKVDEIVFDEGNKIVTTPAYMIAQSISEAASGIEKLVLKLVELA